MIKAAYHKLRSIGGKIYRNLIGRTKKFLGKFGNVAVDKNRIEPILFVDITELNRTDAGTGIQRVVRNIISNLYDESLSCKIVEIYSEDNGSGFFTCAGDLPVAFIRNDTFFCIDFSPSATPANAANFQALHRIGVKIWFFINDLIPVRFPESCGKGMAEAFLRWLKVIVRYDGIIGNSKSTIEDLKTWINENPRIKRNKNIQLEFVHLGSNFAGNSIKCNRVRNSRPVILMVSTVEPRKRYDQAISAFEKLWEKGTNVELRIVGRPGWNNENTITRIEKSAYLNKRLFWYKSGISDEELAKQYMNCDAVLSSSEAEGFGLAVVEGAAYNKPLILRDIPVFREIAQDKAFYFSGFEPDDLANAIDLWLKLYAADKEPRSTDLRLYSWKECTDEAVKIIFAGKADRSLTTRKLFIDLSERHERNNGTGVHRVVNNVMAVFESIKLPFDIVKVYAKHDGSGYYNWINDKQIQFRKGDLFLGLDLSLDLVPQNSKFLKEMQRAGVNISFILYDLVPIKYPDTAAEIIRFWYPQWISEIAKYDRIIAISKAVREDFRKWLAENGDIGYNKAINLEYINLGSNFVHKINMEKPNIKKHAAPAILMVSTIEPRKRYDQAIEAFNILWQEGLELQLKIVGRAGWNNEKTIEMIEKNAYLNKYLFWYNTGISDAELAGQYEDCDAVLACSEDEGFGLAVVEGAAYGKPLILRQIPVFREIAGDNAFYFNGFDPEDLACALRIWLKDYRHGNVPSSDKVRIYSWEECANEIIQILGGNNDKDNLRCNNSLKL